MSTTTVTAAYLTPEGDPCTGRVIFRLVAATYQDGLDAIFPTVPVTAVLDEDGEISIELEPTSGVDAAFDADDMTYQVVERIDGTLRDAYYVDIPTSAAVDLGTLATYDDPPRIAREFVTPDLSSLGYATETQLDTHVAAHAAHPQHGEPWLGITPGHLSTIHAYNPGSVQNTVTPNDATWGYIDSTNLAATFVVPPSGRVLVTLASRCRIDAGAQYRWRLHDGTGGIAESVHQVLQDSAYNVTSQFRSVSFVLSTDNAAADLVPGDQVTVKWQQQSTTAAVVGYAVYGGGAGMATMRIEPVTDRIVETTHDTTVDEDVTSWPLWLCHDRDLILGASSALGGVAYSTDEAASWSSVGGATLSAAGGVIGVRQMDNGEVIVSTPYGGGVGGKLWVSSGFSDGPVGATFTSTLTATGSTTARFTNGWSLDTYGPLVLAAEYGPKAAANDMARYLYLSQDYGQTFTTIFDLYNETGYGVEAHLHGVAYDPWWDAIWLLSGDDTATDGPTATWVSFDLGESWTKITDNAKSTTIIPMPNCVLFGTDSAPNGIYRIPRTSKRYLKGELAYAIDDEIVISHVSQMAFRGRATIDSPALFTFLTAGVTSGPGRLVATYDGYTFREVWNDTGESYNGQGLYSMVGPTLAGNYLGHIQRTGSDHHLVTVSRP